MAHTVMHSGCVTTATEVYLQKVHKTCQLLNTHLVHCTGHCTLIGPNFLWVQNTFILAEACRHFFHTVQRPCLQGVVAFSSQSLSAFKTGLRWIYLLLPLPLDLKNWHMEEHWCFQLWLHWRTKQEFKYCSFCLVSSRLSVTLGVLVSKSGLCILLDQSQHLLFCMAGCYREHGRKLELGGRLLHGELQGWFLWQKKEQKIKP